MNNLFQFTVMLSVVTTMLGVELALPAKPNLNDRLICIAGKWGGFYYITSAINDIPHLVIQGICNNLSVEVNDVC